METQNEIMEEMRLFSEENKKEAGHIVRSFAEKGITMRDAREILRTCEIFLKYYVKIGA